MRELDDSGLTVYPGAVQAHRALSKTERTAMSVLAADVSALMRDIANGHHDTYVKNVFGDGFEDEAKKVFKGAARALDRLMKASGGLVVDVMRKSDVWDCGGLTNRTRMALPEGVVAAAGDRSRSGDAFLTLVHESTHALPKGATTDVLYEHHERFPNANPQAKLATADYYKEVVRQIATATGRIFTPQDVDAHLSTTRSKDLMAAVEGADKVLNGAWVTAIRIHDTIHRMAREPGNFVGWETWLCNASRLMGTSIHREPDLTFTKGGLLRGRNSGPPIHSGDLAVLDNKIAMLAACNGKAKYVIKEPTVALDREAYVEYVITEVLRMFGGGLKFSKSLQKDVIVIRSLGELHESVNGRRMNLLLEVGSTKKPGLAQLPEPMRSYDAAKRI
ncbi:MAG: hypothetical protein JSS47_11355, partial [Proteobacteria bacterium]|nr:hypothetical protein [Pseudomonadota bacterium]